MKSLIILAVIVCIVVFIIAKVLKKDRGVEKTLCPACGKPYGGNPAKCPHCGEQLRWKRR